ncbi:MAG: sigma-70 family RNA polymerase sigma factor [Actinomycetota bacterium]
MSDLDQRRFFEHYRSFVAAFAARRVRPDDVEDIVSEVFAIAWRRRDVVPEDALPWLYRTARYVIGTRYRTDARLAALREKLGAVPLEHSAADPADAVVRRRAFLEAFCALGEDDREMLLLAAWEGLTNAEAATVLGVSPGAAAVRLSRARSRMERHLAQDSKEQTP